MKNIIFLTIILLISSCKTSSFIKIESGVFVHKYKDGDKSKLTLNKDGSFKLIFYYRNIERCESACNGQWKYIARDTIFIQCDPVSWTETIVRCYMSNRECKIKVLNVDKLKIPITNNVKMKYVILERVDSLNSVYNNGGQEVMDILIGSKNSFNMKNGYLTKR